MEIPVNNNKRNYHEEVIQRVINDLKDKSQVMYYPRQESIPIEFFIEAARAFVKKGYYAKVNYFVESWKGVQFVLISKNPVSATNARMVYSEIIH